MLVHVAVALLGLMAISAFAIDFGVFYVSRRQAQNSADAGALAGAIALAYDDANDLSDDGPAKQSAFALSQVNQVWGEPPNVDPPTDITFPVCPDGTSPCVRVDVYRNAARGNALPILFGGLAGIDSQGVRATATAQATASNASACMKPWIIPDMWAEHYPVDPGTWNANTSTFDTHTGNGNNRVELQNPDQYRPPTDSNMTGFRRTGTPNHIGMELTLKAPQPSQQNGGGAVQPGWVYPVRLDEDAPGGNEYMNDILHCSGKVVRIGDWLRNETGIMIGPTMHGVDPLILEDEGATWVDPDGPGGDEGWITGSCMNTASCTGPYAPSPTISPRVFVIPVFNTATFSYSSGAEWLQVVNILGFFLQERTNNEIRGVLIPYQGMYAQGGGAVDEGAAFSYTVRLVR
jgi:Flp pilus assembly protein TadG